MLAVDHFLGAFCDDAGELSADAEAGGPQYLRQHVRDHVDIGSE